MAKHFDNYTQMKKIKAKLKEYIIKTEDQIFLSLQKKKQQKKLLCLIKIYFQIKKQKKRNLK